jgi:tRNA threonylcarbamoyladenosine biosynthesis protein TsaE
LKLRYPSEPALSAAAAAAAVSWRAAGVTPLIVGLRGELGVGKTTWARSMLGGLGHPGRVPSPTFTLLEHYEIGSLTVVHLDLYRLSAASELEFLGVRDFLALPEVWLLVEWPERGGPLVDSLDLELAFSVASDEQRLLQAEARTEAGRQALDSWLGTDLN